MKKILIEADYENNALTWWNALENTYPKLAEAFHDNDVLLITEKVLSALVELPGYDDGPSHARTPFYVFRDKEDVELAELDDIPFFQLGDLRAQQIEEIEE